MSGTSHIITSIEPDDDNGISIPHQKSKLGLQPIADEVPAQFNPKRLETDPFTSFETGTPLTPRWIATLALVSSTIWLLICALIAFSLLNIGENWESINPAQWAGLAMMIFGPLAMIGLAAYAMRQLARISVQATHMQQVTDQLSRPDETVLERSKTLSDAIGEHVDIINAKLNEGVGRISTLKDILKTQTASIEHANQSAKASVQTIDQHLQTQKAAFETIAITYDERMGALSEMMDTHAENLASATRVAEQKIKEARISVEGATAKINSASDIVRANTLEAASTLSGSHDEIQKLGDIIKQRSTELDGVYKKHATDLTAMIEHLRDEQQNIGANMGETLIKMRDLSLSAQASAESLSDASSAGKETIQALAQSASLADDAVKTRFAEMEQMVRYSTEHAQNINTVASQRVQDSLEQTRTEIARIERDMADLQEKLQRSTPVSGKPRTVELSDTRPNVRDRRPRLHVKPIEYIDAELAEETIARHGIDELDDELELPRPVSSADEAATALDLQIETPDVQEIKKGLSPSDPILSAIRPVAEYESVKKSKPGFSLRGLFGGRMDEDEHANLSNAGAGSDVADRNRVNEQNVQSFVQTLIDMGLSPNVLVDDGCVIEAANNRAAHGHEAMSRAVITRLSIPIKHFAATLSSDATLSQRTIEFATEFDHRVETLAGDREAIRTRLESESGRAYLICDAALNYGRV